MLLKLSISTFPKILLYIYVNILQESQYFAYKTKHTMYHMHLNVSPNVNESFWQYVLSWMQEIFDGGFEIMTCILKYLAAISVI